MKLFENNEENEKLLERLTKLESLPSTKQALESEKAETLAKRREAAAAIHAIEVDTATLAKLDREISNMAGHLKMLEDRRDGLANALNEKRAELGNAKNARDAEITMKRNFLFETAWPELAEAERFFMDKLAELRKPGRITIVKTGAIKNLISWKKSSAEESNEPAILEAMRYCMAAVRELQEMRLRPDLDRDRIEALKKGIPRIDRFTETTGEHPLPKDPDPLAGFGTDESHEWSMRRLNAQFRKVMRGGA